MVTKWDSYVYAASKSPEERFGREGMKEGRILEINLTLSHSLFLIFQDCFSLVFSLELVYLTQKVRSLQKSIRRPT